MKIEFTNEQIKKMIELKEIGYTNQMIANHYGCSETTIRRTIKNFCLQSIPKDKKESNAGQITKIKNVEKEENKVENAFNESVKTYKPIERTCIRCNNIFVIPPFEQKLKDAKGFDLPKRCQKCRNELKEKIEIVCVDCNNTFTISVGEKEYLESKGLQLPKRCPVCLKFKRDANEKRIVEENAVNVTDAENEKSLNDSFAFDD